MGRSIGLLLMRKEVNATVDVCHTGTTDLADHVRRADVIVGGRGIRWDHHSRHGGPRCHRPRRRREPRAGRGWQGSD